MLARKTNSNAKDPGPGPKMPDLELSEDPYYRVRKRTPCPSASSGVETDSNETGRCGRRSGSQGALIAGCGYALLNIIDMIYTTPGITGIVGIIVVGGSGIGAGLTEVRVHISLITLLPVLPAPRVFRRTTRC